MQLVRLAQGGVGSFSELHAAHPWHQNPHASGFFLKKFRGGLCDLNDLLSLDAVIYENLRKLRQNPVGAPVCMVACQCRLASKGFSSWMSW